MNECRAIQRYDLRPQNSTLPNIWGCVVKRCTVHRSLCRPIAYLLVFQIAVTNSHQSFFVPLISKFNRRAFCDVLAYRPHIANKQRCAGLIPFFIHEAWFCWKNITRSCRRQMMSFRQNQAEWQMVLNRRSVVYWIYPPTISYSINNNF